MAGGDKSQKTEKPTAKRKKEARERGQVAKTPDLVTWTSLLAATLLLQTSLKLGTQKLPDLLDDMARIIAEPSIDKALSYLGTALITAAVIAAPVVLGLIGVSIVGNLAQVGLVPAWKKLKPNFKALNPMQGIKKMFQPASLWELAKSVVKVAILFVVAWPTFNNLVSILTGPGLALGTIVGTVGATALRMIRNIAGVGLVIAAVDYLVQRRRISKELMMTKEEMRQEHKQQEGNPEVRAAIRSRQQAVSRNRMIRAVGQADVVVVNPTHYAVALRYDPAKGAPEVLAKGVDHLAARIRLEATKHGVPIVREPATARALYAACEVGQFIPIELYEAVAHLLAFIFSLRARGRAEGYHEFGRELVEAPF